MTGEWARDRDGRGRQHVWTGAHAGDYAPYHMDSIGDADADGLDDLLVGVPSAHGDPAQSEAYLALGAGAATRSLADAAATCTNATVSAYFGARVASLGDIDGDGDADVGIATLYDDTYGTATGSVTVYDMGGLLAGCDAATATLTGEAAGDQFGSAITHGDIDGDGFDELFVDAVYQDGGAVDGGAVYMFGGPLGATGAEDPTAALVLYGNSGDYFGARLSVGDIDSDGYADLAIGAAGDDVGGDSAGAVHILLGTTLQTASSGSISADGVVLGEGYGDMLGTVDITGDLDGDGTDDLLVGAYNKRTGGDLPGKVYVWFAPILTGSIGAATADVGLEGESSGDHAGQGVVVVGDINADGCDDALVTAPNAAWTGTNSGGAYLLYGCALTYRHGSLADAHARFVPAAGDYLGILNADPVGRNDFNGDGIDDFWVAAPYADEGGTSAGTIYGFPGG